MELRALIKTAEVINPELPEDAENLGDFLNELGINNEARDFYANGLRYGVPFWLLKKWYSTYKNTYMGYWDPSYLYRGKKASTGPIGYGSGVGKMGKSGVSGKAVNQHPTGALVGGGKVVHRKKRHHVSRFKKLENKVKKLNKNLPKFSKHTAYKFYPWIITSTSTAQTPANLVICNYTEINGLMNSLPYLAYSAPQTKANTNVVDPGASLTAHDMSFKVKIYAELELRNNNTYAADLWLYLVRPKTPTSEEPITKLTTAVLQVNQQTSPSTAAAYTDPLWRPSHFAAWVRDWDIVETYKQHMVPGQEFKVFFNRTVTHSSRAYSENGSLANDPVNTYWWLAFARGSIAHESATVGYSPVSLDAVEYRKMSVRYESDFPTTTFDYSSGLTVLTTPVQVVNDLN